MQKTLSRRSAITLSAAAAAAIAARPAAPVRLLSP